MKVFVNDTEVKTYYGAKVKSAILVYCRDNKLNNDLQRIEVRDAFGNMMDIDGALRSNTKIYVRFF